MRDDEENPAPDGPRAAAPLASPIALSGLGLVVLLFIVHAIWLNGVSDDAYITFRFAEHFAAGHGLVWNIGEAPVEGYTNFLWLILCAGVSLLGFDLPLASQVMGFVASTAILVMLYRGAISQLGCDARTALAPPLFLAFSGPFATWAGAGLETNLFAAFVLAAVLGFARLQASDDAHDRHITHLHITLAALLLAALTRPEGVLVAGLLAILAVMARLRRSEFAIGRGARWAMAYFVVFALYFAWRWHYFGYPLPNTFYAKTGGGLEQASRGLGYVGLFTLHFLLPWLAVAGVWIAVKRSSAPSDNELGAGNRAGASPDLAAVEVVGNRAVTIDGGRRILLASCALIVIVYTMYIAMVGGDYMAMYRFFVPILPLLALLIGAAFDEALSSARKDRRAIVWAALVAGLLASGFHSTPLEKAIVAPPDRMHGNFRGVETERWYVARHRLIGEFFARYGREGESLATGAIGGVAYYSGLRVYDVHGIVDSHIAHEGRSQATLGSGLPGHEKTDYVYLFEKKPTFYMFNRKLWERPLEGIPRLVDEVDARVAREYRVGSIWLEDPINGEAGYFAFLERRDREQRGRSLRGPSLRGPSLR